MQSAESSYCRNASADRDHPELVIVGHVCLDKVDGGDRLGGAVYYAAAAATRLGVNCGIVTACDAPTAQRLQQALPAVQLAVQPSPLTTRFHNQLVAGTRRQHLLARAADIELDAVPLPWRQAPLALLAPVIGEYSPAMFSRFSANLVCVAPQGWLRSVDEHGQVGACLPPELTPALALADLAVLSSEDLAGRADWEIELAGKWRQLVVTCGERGARAWLDGNCTAVPPCATVSRDPTGAGDVFAAALLIAYNADRELLAAANYAACAASFAVEQPDVGGLASHQEVLARLARRQRQQESHRQDASG